MITELHRNEIDQVSGGGYSRDGANGEGNGPSIEAARVAARNTPSAGGGALWLMIGVSTAFYKYVVRSTY